MHKIWANVQFYNATSLGWCPSYLERISGGLGARVIRSQRMEWMVGIVRERRSISLLGIEKELEKLVDRHRLVDGTTKGLYAALDLIVGHGRRVADALEEALQLGVLDDAVAVPVGLLDDVAEVGVGSLAIEVRLVVLLQDAAELGLALVHQHVSVVGYVFHADVFGGVCHFS